MLEKNVKNREQVEFICLENLVPEEHLLRKIDRAVDFDKIYDFVEELYCLDNGRPSIDPIILFKMVLIQHLYGIRSLRRVAEEVSEKHTERSRLMMTATTITEPRKEETIHQRKNLKDEKRKQRKRR